MVSDVQSALDPFGNSLSPPQVPLTANGLDIQPNTQIEPAIAVNPGDPNDVVTAFQIGRVDPGGDANNGFATSLDGGTSWSYGNLPGLTRHAPAPTTTANLCPTDPNPEPFDRASDASVTFGRDPSGKALGGYFVYAQSLVFDDTSCNGLPSGMAINASSDGGRTWTRATILESDAIGGLNDKNWILADNGTGPGHHPGRVYVVWDRVVPVVYSYCDPDVQAPTASRPGCDIADNWSSVHNNSWYLLFPGQGIGTMPVVMNSGDLGVMFTSLTANPCSVPSTDQPSCSPGGNQIEFGVIPGAGSVPWPAPLPPTTWAPVTVATYDSNGVEDQRAGGLPQVAYDNKTGDAFIAWEDNRFRTDGGCTPPCSNQNDAVIAVSKPLTQGGDAGYVWSSPVRVNPGPTNNYVDHYNTMIAVGADGILRVGYRQRYEPKGMSPIAAGPSAIQTYYQESRNQGATFSAPIQVNTEVQTDPSFGAFSRGGLFQGDYQMLAAGRFDETFVVRDEAFAPPHYSGPYPCLKSFAGFPTDSSGRVVDCQNQTTWVAHLLPKRR